MAKKSKPRGFAALDPEKRREIARKGGLSVPAADRFFSTHPELAAEAGHKGGSSIDAEKRSFSQDRSLARRAGKKSAAVRKAKAPKP